MWTVPLASKVSQDAENDPENAAHQVDSQNTPEKCLPPPPPEDARASTITPTQQMMSSCSGALLTSLLMTPLDVVKIRMQAQHNQLHKGGCFLYCNGLMDHLCSVNCAICANGKGNGLATAQVVAKEWYARPGHFTGTTDALIKIARNEGVTSLWSGLPPTLLMAVPATVVYFTSYDQLKYYFGYKENDPSTKYLPVLAGASARVLAATLVSPLELLRTKMQSEKLTYTELREALRFSLQEQGVRSLFRGLGATLLRDVPFSAIYWFSYELLKARELRRTRLAELSLYESFLAGAVSGTLAAVITLPFDVVKTHRQMELGVQMTGSRVNTSTWGMLRSIYREKGPSALFAGIMPRVLRIAPACAVMISSYEFGKNFFRHRQASYDS